MSPAALRDELARAAKPYRAAMSLLAGIDRRDVALTAVVVALGQVDAFAPGLYGTSVVGPRWAGLADLPGRRRWRCWSGVPGPGWRSPSASERLSCRR